MVRSIAAVIAVSFFLAACGSTTGDRAASGAGIGAAAGTVLGAVTGLGIVQGAAIGALAGGVIGGTTDKSTVNLGEPIWAKGDRAANSSAVHRVQSGLARLGYQPGPVDGVMGNKTVAAIRRYQGKHRLLVDGRPTIELAGHIERQLQLANR